MFVSSVMVFKFKKLIIAVSASVSFFEKQ